MTEQLVDVPGATICVEGFGAPGDPAVLLLGGIGMAMDWWEPPFCARLAAAGRHVIRYDHRDTGRSTCWPPGAPDYSADDLQADPLHVLDALGVDRAHLVGLSMGGGISQEIAAQHPERVASLTLVATSPAGKRAGGEPLPPPEPALAASFADPAEPDWDDRDAVVEHMVAEQRLYAGPRLFDEERVRRLAELVLDRSASPASAGNHAVCRDGTAPPFALADLAVPTLVLHGTADPLFPLPHGRALAAEIPGARLLLLDGVGAEPPGRVHAEVAEAVLAHTQDRQ
jgi:pimeloyl-ACP methyl ester carboxylesterase